jgi:type IV pilus assembly protein PilB
LIGAILLERGLIDEPQLNEALLIQGKRGGLLGEILVSSLMLTEEQIADAVAAQRGLRRVNLVSDPIDHGVVRLLPERMERMRRMIPIAHSDGKLVLAMANPLDIEAIDDVRLLTRLDVEPVVATPSQIRYAIEKHVASADVVDEISAVSAAGEEEEQETEVVFGDAPVVKLVSQVFRDAVADNASDVHIEPTKHNVRVRFRVDGVLHDMMELPRSTANGIASRIKVLSEMDLAERRRPQDGRISLNIDGNPIDLRVAVVPVPDGESIVIRVLNQGAAMLTLKDLGMGPDDLALVDGLLANPWGSILVSGPTGSGKSTTLYAMLTMLNNPGRKLITIEDPIEYRLAGVTQIAVNPAIDLSFATLLRQVVRFDPDIVLVGEIRDTETAQIATRAALTGHLVLSSIHTNDAASTLTRMTDMGVAGFSTSSSIRGIVAQRLVRKLCPFCSVPDEVPQDVLVGLGFTPEEAAAAHPKKSVGCSECMYTGYHGRVGIFEILVMDDDVRQMFLRDAAADELRALAVTNGMRTLRSDGLGKVAGGITSLNELSRVVV